MGSGSIAGTATLCFLALLLVFHVLVLTGAFPDDMVWGGRANAGNNPRRMEILGVAITLLFMFIAAGRAGIILERRFRNFFSMGAWFMAAYFMMNSVGNVFSDSSTERAIFLTISIALAVLSIVLALRGGK